MNGASGQYARFVRLKKEEEFKTKDLVIEQLKENIRKKLYYSGAAMDKVDLKELGLLLLIISNLQELDLSEEKWKELRQSEEPLNLLYERCKGTLSGTEFEIQDSLLSCINIGIL